MDWIIDIICNLIGIEISICCILYIIGLSRWANHVMDNTAAFYFLGNFYSIPLKDDSEKITDLKAKLAESKKQLIKEFKEFKLLLSQIFPKSALLTKKSFNIPQVPMLLMGSSDLPIFCIHYGNCDILSQYLYLLMNL